MISLRKFRLRKHDRKMLKVSALLASFILIMLGLILVDVVRGLPTSGSLIPGSHSVQYSNHKLSRNAGNQGGLVNVDFKRLNSDDQMFFADGSGTEMVATFIDASDASTTSNAAFIPSNNDCGKSTGSAIPEPSTLGIAAIGAMLLLTTRHRKFRLAAA